MSNFNVQAYPHDGKVQPSPLQVWGGVECTVNRVCDHYFDQMQMSGHDRRLDDFERFAALGMTSLRVGLLWERQHRDSSWAWADAALSQLRQSGIRPIVGLVHHGSGPKHTSLLDPAFPEKLALYAGSVARRYPWVEAYTPVNEPNTTARFSGMYGIWYPHHQSRLSYLRALLNQMKATVLSMRAIRKIQPDATLVQTEDLGQIWSTAPLASTRDLWNERRWLPFDLLCGMVDRDHPLFSYIEDAGIPEREILFFRDNPCPPQVIGMNYYLTSDRFIDHRLHLYPHNRQSSEGAFADLEAVRVRHHGIAGFESVLGDAWARYKLPIALTEVHLGCSVDEQIRWAFEAWEGTVKARDAGVNCIALTFWALLGSFFWDTLVTSEDGAYEPGVFDISGGIPVPTDLAQIVAQLGRGQAPQDPALCQEGWWRDESRLHYRCLA